MNRTTGGGPMMDIYARLSFAPNGDTINVDDQVDWCTDAVGERGGVVGEVFKDNSLSAWRPNVRRPEWEALMRRLEAGESDGVMVLDLTRFSRKVMEGERLVDLAGRGVRVWSLAGSYELSTADGRRHFRESMVAAAAESDKISERVKRGKLRRARRGRMHGGQRGFALAGYVPAPPGWELGDPRELVAEDVVAAERAVVRECYRRLFAGESLSGLVRELNARGVRTVEGNPWQRHTLARSLSRPALAGLCEYRGTIVGTLVGVEPVVSREEWERLCGLFAARRLGRPPGKVHMLAGLIRCGRCGRAMLGAPRRNLPPYPDGSFKREYRCRRNSDRPECCGANYIDGLTADRAVGEAVKARLGDPRHAERIARRLAAAQEQRAGIEAEITRLEASADDLAEKTAAWGVARVEKAMTPILRRIDQLQTQLAGLDEPEDAHTATADAVQAWDEAHERGDVDALRAMVRRAFPRLTLRPHTKRGDHSVERFDWDGTTLPSEPTK